MLKLNLGSGDKPISGFANIDRRTGGEVYPLTPVDIDVTHFGSPDGYREFKPGGYGDATVDEVRASHILEHFPHTETEAVLAEWVRVLKPGGVIKIAVPNYDWIRAHPDHPMAEGYLFGGHTDDNDRHGALFTEAKLRGLMEAAGLYDIGPWVSEIDDCASLPVSLNLMGIKGPRPDKPRVQIPPVLAVLSRPRYGPLGVHSQLRDTLNAVGVPIAESDGAFWGQCLTRLMEAAVAKGYQWLLTLDFDSIITKPDVTGLLRLMAEHPEADAIAALEVRRCSDEMLAGLFGPDGQPLDQLPVGDESPLTRVDCAHFGLTLLRVPSLLKLRHPWFLGVPNETGRWDDGRQDDDIYFWRKWREAGNSVYVAHHVAIGHAQVLFTWPGNDGRPIHQYASEFYTRGKPQGVRT